MPKARHRNRIKYLASLLALIFLALQANGQRLAATLADDGPKADLPKVLIIGDSVSKGYTPHVQAMLDGKALVSPSKGNAQHTGVGLKLLDQWLGETKWDVIHFNWGLWDLCYRHPKSKVQGKRDKINGTLTTPPDEYKKNLEKLVVRLKATGAKLIWASTSYVPQGEAGRKLGDDLRYNQAAREVMKKHGVETNDINALTKKFEGDLFVKPGDVHYTEEGYRLIGKQVSETILAALPNAHAVEGRKKEARSDASPNVLLIYIDDMGYGDLGCYGSETKTPNIDQLAADGIRFTNYLSASNVCSPSRAAVLAGRYPQRAGLPVCPNGNAQHPDWNEHVGLPLSEVTIAELLKPKGYATAAFGKWHLGVPEHYGPMKQGFDTYRGSLWNFPVGKANTWYHDEQPKDKIRFAQAHQRLTDATIGFMQQQHESGKPFFIYLSHYLVHGPWSPNKAFCTPAEWASYQKKKGRMNPTVLPAMVRELDHHVGLVLDALDELGIAEDTLVIFASDNGPWLPAGSAEPFAEGKYTTKEGGHRVPAMVRWPGKIPAGQVSDEMVSAMDVLPTIASASDIALPEDRALDGYDLMPLLSGENENSPRNEFAYYNGLTLEAVRQGDWKLHLPRDPSRTVYWGKNKGAFKNLKNPVLVNLTKDITETRDVSQGHPDQWQALQALAARTRDLLGDWNKRGSDRPKSTYPGDLNTPNWKKSRK